MRLECCMGSMRTMTLWDIEMQSRNKFLLSLLIKLMLLISVVMMLASINYAVRTIFEKEGYLLLISVNCLSLGWGMFYVASLILELFEKHKPEQQLTKEDI